MPSFTHQGRSIYYEITGKGSTIILLHGFCESLRIWDGVVDQLVGYQIIRLDLAGFGKTAMPIEPSIDAMATDVYILAQHLELDSFILLGHSMGGYVSLAFAEFYPQYLKGLGLVHSYAHADSEEKQRGRNKGIKHIELHGTSAFFQQLFKTLFPKTYKNQAIIDQLIASASEFSDQVITTGLIAMRDRPDRTEVLRCIDCPVLFIIGEEDEVVPFDKSLEATYLPGVSAIHILEKVGHMSMFEAPEVLTTSIQQFAQYTYQVTESGIT